MTNLQISALLLLAICISHALSLMPNSISTRTNRQRSTSSSSSLYSSQAAPGVPPSSLRDRMLQQVIGVDDNKSKKKKMTKKKKNSLVQEIRTISEYRKAVVEEADGKFVAVWFYAPWCRGCRATQPGFASLAKHHPEVKFVKVPVVEDNINLHQGLDIPSVPYLHLYHPTLGLIQEQKLARKHLPGFHKLLQDYVADECSLERSGEWSSATPYAPAPKSRC